MMHNHFTNKSGRITLLLLSLVFMGLVLFSGAALAGEVSVPIPSGELKAGTTVTLPVILTDAVNINGYQITVSELSGGEVTINTAADMVAGTNVLGNGKKAVLMTTATPLNGDVTLFSVDVTPVSGKNAIVSVEVIDILNSADDSVTDAYPGKDTVIPVENGKTVYVKSSANSGLTTTTVSPSTVMPVYEERISSSSSSSSSTSSSQDTSADVPTASSTTKATKTKKSPGFLPLTLILGGLAAAGIIAVKGRRS